MPYNGLGYRFRFWELDVLDRGCRSVGGGCTSAITGIAAFIRSRPVELVCKLNHCPDPMPRPRQDEEPRTGGHDRPTELGDRLGRLLLDWTSTVFTPLVDYPDSGRVARQL